jgi:hypothetical protein
VSIPSHAATLVPRRLDGVYVKIGKENLWPIAVMIDNHTAARPQSSLQKASMVYESLAEGGIPRFMAVYADPSVGTVGPVRSTRPYFVRFAAEYNAALAHAGGSPDGIALLKKTGLINLEGLKKPYANLFFRAYGGGVHGLYTTMPKLWKAISATRRVKILKPSYAAYTFTDAAPLAQRGKNKGGVTIDLGYGKLYDIKYVYNKKTNSYARFTGGVAHRDRQTKSQISVKNIIIQITPKEKVLDRKGRLDIQTIGSGKGILLQNGKSQTITWKKSSVKGRTIYKNKFGSEIQLVRGNTWITVVPKGHSYKIF